MQQVLCSVSYHIAIGLQQGAKVFTLQTISSWEELDRFVRVAKESGKSFLKQNLAGYPKKSLHTLPD